MKTTSIEELINVVRKIRHPEDGCPWDLKQTHESLLKYLVEESYEYIQAVDEKNIDKMRDELGDVLFQVVLHSQIASESNQFNFDDVAEGIREKMVRRHPHVFESKEIAKTEQEVIDNWNKIKSAEKKKPYYFMEQDAYGPGLKMADEIGKKSTKVNFDWDNSSEVWEKVKEELLEVEAEYKNKNKEELEEEIGDLLFSIADKNTIYQTGTKYKAITNCLKHL